MKLSLLLPLIFFTMQNYAQKSDYNLIVGTYTNSGKSEGIYVYNFNIETSDFELKNIAKGIENPSYLAVSADNKFVYAVNETSNTSAVSAFSFQPATAELKLLNKLGTQGNNPCYVIADEKNVISANYSGGNISVFGIEKDGSLAAIKQIVQHHGNSVNKSRQSSPHVHMVQFTPDKKYLVVNDLGTDKVYLYKYNADGGATVLTAHDSVSITPGAGPRHITFSKDGSYAYVMHEMDGGITAFSYTEGTLKKIQEVKVTGQGFSGENGGADIHISPDGKFLYATNRGTENNITVFGIEKGGLLTKKSQVPTLGKGPRNFTIDPSGRYLLVGHQYTNDVVIFERNKKSGALKDTGKRIMVGAPVCLVFASTN